MRITRNTGTRETRGEEDYKVKPKRNHCYGHTPQAQKGPYPRIQKGLKHPTLAWNEIRFVTTWHPGHQKTSYNVDPSGSLAVAR